MVSTKISFFNINMKGSSNRLHNISQAVYLIHTKDDNSLVPDRHKIVMSNEQSIRTYDELFDDKFNLNRANINVNYIQELYYYLHSKGHIGNNVYHKYSNSLLNNAGYKSEMFNLIMEASVEAFKHYDISMDEHMILLSQYQLLSHIFKCGMYTMNFQGSHYKGLNFYVVESLHNKRHIVKVVTKDLNNMVVNEELSDKVSDYVFDKLYDHFLGENGNLDTLNYMRAVAFDGNVHLANRLYSNRDNLIGEKYSFFNDRTSNKLYVTPLTLFCIKTRDDEKYSFTKLNGKIVNLKKGSVLETLDKNSEKYIETKRNLIKNILFSDFYTQDLRLFDSLSDLTSTNLFFAESYVDWVTLDVDNLTKNYVKIEIGDKTYYTTRNITQNNFTYPIRDDLDCIKIEKVEYEKLSDYEVNSLMSYHKMITNYYKEGLFTGKKRTEVYRFLRKLKKIVERRDKVFELGNMTFYVCDYTGESYVYSPDFPSILMSFFNVTNISNSTGYYVREKTKKVLEKENIVMHNINGIGTIYSKKDKVELLEHNLAKVNDKDLSKYNVEAQSRMNEYSFSPNKSVAIVKDDDNVFKVEKLYEVDKSKLLYGVELEFDKSNNVYVQSDFLNEKDKVIAVSNHLLSQGLPSVYTTRDGSLTNGFETKTIPVEYDLLFNDKVFDWDSYFDFIRKSGYTGENDTCGLHIHISKSHFIKPEFDFKEQVEILSAMFSIVLNNNRDYLIDFSRRNYANIERWARFNTKIDNDLKLSKVITPESSTVLLRRYIYRINDDYTRDRYTALNVRKSATFEFRIFRGVDSKDVLLDTLKLVNIIATKIKDIWDRFTTSRVEKEQVEIFLELDKIDLESEMSK